MNPIIRVFYYQPTLGAAHLARVRALDLLDGIRCTGIQLASEEKTRISPTISNDPAVETILDGTYESISLFRRICAACRHLRSSRPDVIIIDSPADPVQWFLGRFAQRLGIKAMTRWAATLLDHPRKRWKEMLKGFIYRGWDHYLVTGERGLLYLRSFGVPISRITVCGNPVAASALDPDCPPVSEGRRNKSFLFVGRFLKLKNLEEFTRAYLEYRRRGGTWELILVGSGESEAEVRSLACNVASIRLLGNLPFEQIAPLYRSEGALVLPSYSENWGLVVNEAMHSGMPVIVSTRCGCFPELVEPNSNGVGMDPLDRASMADALMTMEHMSDRKRQDLGRRGREIIQAYRPEAWARRVAEAISSGFGKGK